ncbi:MAG: iron/manganese transporter, partial [Sphingobacteriales bacterium]
MEGYLSLRLNPILRRLITRLVAIVPAIIVIAVYGEDEVDALLVMSQVVLSLQLGYAIIPLIHFVSDKKSMGNFVIKPHVKIAAWLIASVLVFLNLKMLFNEVTPIFASDALLPKVSIIAAGLFFGGILIYIILQPLVKKEKKQPQAVFMHHPVKSIPEIIPPSFKKIAIALDFSSDDYKLLSYAVGQGRNDSAYILLHIVESAGAKLLGKDTDDFESRKDQEQLNNYVLQLKNQGYEVEGHIGFRNRVKEIVRIVQENNADMLVIGAHGHTGIKDFIYGETVNAVRHELKIPVLVVTL